MVTSNHNRALAWIWTAALVLVPCTAAAAAPPTILDDDPDEAPPAASDTVPVADPVAAYEAWLDNTADADLDPLLADADALVAVLPDDPRAHQARHRTHERLLLRTLSAFGLDLESALTTVLATRVPGLDYTALADRLDIVVDDLEHTYIHTLDDDLLLHIDVRAHQAERARDHAEAPKLLPVRTSPSRRPAPPAPAFTPVPKDSPPPPPRDLQRVSNGLGIGFTLAGAAAIVGGGVQLSGSIVPTAAGSTVHLPTFVLGSTLAIGGSAMLGGGAGQLVATAVARDPARRRPIRHASWLFLVSAGAFASAATYVALDAHQQSRDVTRHPSPTASFNTATILGAVAVSQLAIFAGMHRAAREPRPNQRYSLVPPALGVTRQGATATIGIRF